MPVTPLRNRGNLHYNRSFLVLWDPWEQPSLVGPHGCPGVFSAHALNSTVQPGAACKRKKKMKATLGFFQFSASCKCNHIQHRSCQSISEWVPAVCDTSHLNPIYGWTMWPRHPQPRGYTHWQLQAWEAFIGATNAQEDRKRKLLMDMTHFRHSTRDGAEECQGSLSTTPFSFSNINELLQEEKAVWSLYPVEILSGLKLCSKISSFFMLGITNIWMRTN